MGTCSSSHSKAKPADDQLPRPSSPSAKVVDMEGRLQEFRRLITAADVLSGHPNCYLCNSDSMLINSTSPQFPKDDVLQLGQIYFLMPLSKSLTPLSLQDLCDLAVKASRALDAGSAPFLHDCKSFRWKLQK